GALSSKLLRGAHRTNGRQTDSDRSARNFLSGPLSPRGLLRERGRLQPSGTVRIGKCAERLTTSSTEDAPPGPQSPIPIVPDPGPGKDPRPLFLIFLNP